MNKLNAHAPRPLLRLLLPLLLLVPLGSASHAADTASFKFVRVMTGDVTDRPALNSLMEKWVPFVKEHFPASHVSEFQTDDSGKATFVDFAKDLSEFERNDKEFLTEVEKYQSLNLPNLFPVWEQSFTALETSVWENQPELSYAPSGGDSWEQPFRMIRIFHLKRDKEGAFAEALKALNEVDRKAGITAPRLILKLKFGPDAPAIAMITPAKDVLDYYTNYAKRTELRAKDPKGKETLDTLRQATRRSEIHHATLNPEFSKLK
jgi:hypothetical protein